MTLKNKKIFTILFSLQLLLLGVVLFVEYFNLIIFAKSKMVHYHGYDIAFSAVLLRMKLWKFHLFAGLLISLIYIVFSLLFLKKKYFLVIVITMFLSGLFIFFFENKIILLLHIISSVVSVFVFLYLYNRNTI